MQTSYSLNISPAQAGQIGDSGFHDIVSRKNTASALLFGHAVKLGASEGEVIAPAAAADITDLKLLQGVVVASQTLASSSSGDPQYPLKSTVPVMRKGRIWVKTESTVTVGTSGVHVRYAGVGNAGAFRGATVSMETAQIPDAQAKWVVGASASGFALLELNL